LRPEPTEVSGFRVEQWLEAQAIAGVPYADYWNDEEIERGKEWNVLEGGFEPMERYLDEVGLVEDLRACVALAEELRGRPLQGIGVDLAAGTLWAAHHLLAAGPVERLYCVEYSRHRLLKLGPVVLERAGVSPEQVVLALGSFYDIRLEEASVDFAFMSQALHHADEPDRLLAELERVLQPDGVVIAIGEHVVGLGWRLAHAAGHADHVDAVTGDHYYGVREYARMFDRHGFRYERVRRSGADFQGFVLTRG
jgi:ubiquinone/menaquinone biosynthesis C-methylase UbiE